MDTPIYDLAVEGEYEALEEMLANDPGLVNETDKNGFTPLHGVAAEEHSDVARLLIERGAAVNAANDQGVTPLHLAATAEMAALLLDSGAKIDAITDDGFTPLHLAVSESRSAGLIRKLLRRGADPGIPNKYGVTASEAAQERGDAETREVFRSID